MSPADSSKLEDRCSRDSAEQPAPADCSHADYSHFDALIFDCDGTLVDSMPLHFQAWQTALSLHGIEFSQQRFLQLAGVPTRQIIELLGRESGQHLDVDAIVSTREQEFARLSPEVQAVEPVIRIARHYRGQKPMAVASGSTRAAVEFQLRRLGVLDWFQTVVAAEDTERHKPEPDVFLEAARRLGCQPERCVVFEDADLGLQAAQRAGMQGVDVRPWMASFATDALENPAPIAGEPAAPISQPMQAEPPRSPGEPSNP